MSAYFVAHGNIGTIHRGSDLAAALCAFREAADSSASDVGSRGYGESATLWCEDEPLQHYTPAEDGIFELQISDAQRDDGGGWIVNGCWVHRYVCANLGESDRAIVRRLKNIAGCAGERWDLLYPGAYKVRGAAIVAFVEWQEHPAPARDDE